MNAKPKPSPVGEINRLHAEVQRHTGDSRAALTAALVAAWHAGQLLAAERTRVKRAMGRGAWSEWLRVNFRGTARTAQRYIRLSAVITDPSFMQGVSLRQAYFRLGIATEPKQHRVGRRGALPDYVRLALRLTCALNAERRRHVAADVYRRDLRPLYEKLAALFENSSTGSGSKGIWIPNQTC